MNIVIVGAGLLGGSFGLAAKAVDETTKVIVVEKNAEIAQKTVELQIADVALSFHEAMRIADLVVLATPVDLIQQQVVEVLDLVDEHVVVTDLGSTKAGICEAVEQHPNRKQFVAAHPMAGTEFSGPEAAFAALFQKKICVICDKHRSDKNALAIVEKLLTQIGMDLLYMDAKEHDRHLAYVSHLSHITSFALGVTVLEKEKDEKTIFDMASTGFSSTVRLAKSSPVTWAPIFAQNKENLLPALDSYIAELQKIRGILAADQTENSREWMRRANEIRRVLAGIDIRITKK